MYTVDMLLEDSIGRSCATGGSPTGLLKTPTNTVGRMRTQPAHTLGTGPDPYMISYQHPNPPTAAPTVCAAHIGAPMCPSAGHRRRRGPPRGLCDPRALCGRHLEQLARSSRLRATAATVPLVFMMIEESCTLLSTGTVRRWSTWRLHDSPLSAIAATGRARRAGVRVGSQTRPGRGV